ncbi:MAG: hypothetical protein O2917_06615 [Acidobacteria bacterium]|nr:hypothetical protein [Acidobacteriota bacterium]
MTSRRWWVGVLCVLVLSVAPTGGTTLLPADFRLVVAEATVIVRGRVTDVRAVRSVRGDVESVATIAVDAVLKGEAGSFVSMRVPGGTIGRFRTHMPGAPTVAVGDAAVYLLKRAPGGALWPVGLSSGIYRISVSRGRLMVAPPVVAAVTTAAQGPVVRGDLRRRTLPLADFESIVTLVLRGAQRTTPLRVTPGVRGGLR